MNASCPNCKISGSIIGFSIQAEVNQCSRCGLLFLADFVRVNAQHDNNWGKALVDGPFEWGEHLVEANRSFFSKQLATLEALVEGRSLLDVGCGAGVFLKVAEKQGWKVLGVEESEHWRKFIETRYQLPCYDSLDKIPQASIDVIRLSHVLEHIWDPLPFLQALRSKLKPGGVLFILVPNAEPWPLNWVNRFRRLFSSRPKFTGAIYPDMHVLGFNPRSFRHLVCSHGFKAKQVFSVSMGNSTYYPFLYDGLLRIRRLKEYGSFHKFRALLISLAHNLGSPLGRGEWLVGYFQKNL